MKNNIAKDVKSSSSSVYYLGEFSPLAGVGQSFHCSPPTLPIPCILLHYSPLFHVFLYQVNPSFHWPASLSSFFYFQLQHFLYLHLLNLFCLKCSSKSSTSTLDAISVLSTLSFIVSPQTILLSSSRSLWNTSTFIAQVSAPYIKTLVTHTLYKVTMKD